MAKITVTVYGAKSLGSDEIGLAVLKTRFPPDMRGKKNKRRRRAYADGVAEGVRILMEHIQPEGDGLSSWPQQ